MQVAAAALLLQENSATVLNVRKYQSWASPQVSPQIRNCGLMKKVADMRTCGLWQFKLRTCGCGLFLILVRNSASLYKY